MLRPYLGVALHRHGLRVVCLRKRGGRLRATWASGPCEGISPAPDRPMLESPDRFVEAVRAMLLPLAGTEDRIGLSLPDICGRTVFLRLPATPASTGEEQEMLRWKLQETLACDPGEIRMACGRTTVEADGTWRYAVNVVRESLFAQLVEGFTRAGFQVDFAGFKTFNLWQQARMENPVAGKQLLLVPGDESQTLLAADNDRLLACRTVATPAGGEPIGEIARTLADWKRRKVIDEQTPFFLSSEEGDEARWSENLARSLGRQTRPLIESEGVDWVSAPAPTGRQRSELSAALAAARLLGGGKL